MTDSKIGECAVDHNPISLTPRAMVFLSLLVHPELTDDVPISLAKPVSIPLND